MFLIKNRFVIFSAGVITGLIVKSLLEQSSPKECPFDLESPFLCRNTLSDPELEPKFELESDTDTGTDTQNGLDENSPKA